MTPSKAPMTRGRRPPTTEVNQPLLERADDASIAAAEVPVELREIAEYTGLDSGGALVHQAPTPTAACSTVGGADSSSPGAATRSGAVGVARRAFVGALHLRKLFAVARLQRHADVRDPTVAIPVVNGAPTIEVEATVVVEDVGKELVQLGTSTGAVLVAFLHHRVLAGVVLAGPLTGVPLERGRHQDRATRAHFLVLAACARNSSVLHAQARGDRQTEVVSRVLDVLDVVEGVARDRYRISPALRDFVALGEGFGDGVTSRQAVDVGGEEDVAMSRVSSTSRVRGLCR